LIWLSEVGERAFEAHAGYLFTPIQLSVSVNSVWRFSCCCFFSYYQPACVCTSFETLKHLEMAASGVGLVYDSRMCAHENESDRKHPEQPARITSIYQRLTSAGVVARFLSFFFLFSPFPSHKTFLHYWRDDSLFHQKQRRFFYFLKKLIKLFFPSSNGLENCASP
jgi:hypothetical protein